MLTEISNKNLLIYLEKDLYSADVVYKCFYWYGDNFNIDIQSYSSTQFLVTVIPKNEQEDLKSLIEKIQKDLIDFKLRDIVTKETKTIRELIIAKAFAYYGIDDNPITNVSDPVGFEPNAI